MTDQFANIALEALVSSPTNPRKTFNEVRLQELANSIKASGVHQPILVRQLPAQQLLDTAHLKPRPTHEIVAGERRYRASKLAGVGSIPVMIRDLTDDQVLEIQIVENIQRDSLTELETAEGYKTLMDHNHLTADEVGQKVSKSRSSIYGTLKLLDLHPYGKECLREDSITASHALLIARIPDVKLQHKAVDYAAAADDNGHKPSIRAFQQWLRDNVMLDLEKAPFPIAVKTLTTAGSCEDCDKRTGANPDLFTDVKSADVCTHPPCYHLKAEAHKINLDSMVKTIPKEANKNVDLQQGLELASTLAQDARAESKALNDAAALKNNLSTICDGKDLKIAFRTRHAIFDKLKDHIKATKDNECCELLGSAVFRVWLLKLIDWQTEDEIFQILGMDTTSHGPDLTALQDAAVLRVKAASNSDIFRYTTLAILIEDRETRVSRSDRSDHLFIAFANDHGIDIEVVRDEVMEDVEDETKAKIASINKQIKAKKGETSAPKTTSTPPPAGAAIDDAAAGAKNKGKNASHAAQARKSKTSTEEAISGIATAMQSLGSEPLDASLGGSEAAAGRNGVAVGTKVEVQFGRHFGKTGTVTSVVGENMFDVLIGDGPKATTTRLSGQQFTKVKS
jgi:ParB/RepB/Spo0J family partition protein